MCPLYYLDLLEEGIALYDMGYKEAGIWYLLKAFERQDTPQTRGLLSKALEKIEE